MVLVSSMTALLFRSPSDSNCAVLTEKPGGRLTTIAQATMPINALNDNDPIVRELAAVYLLIPNT